MKENKLLFGYMFFAYIFVLMFHLYWAYWAWNIPKFHWHGHLMINNVDGYFYGSGAQKILYGLHADNPRLDGVMHYGTSVVTAYIAKFFHISIDQVMLYIPAVVSSLVVIPIILITKLYKNLEWGGLAAILGGITWSYYNRTLAGYYDTDMFSASLPMFILYFLLAAIKKENLAFTLLAGFTVIIYPWLYDQGLSIVYGMGIMAFIYMIIFNYKKEFTYQFILLFSIALFDMNPFIKSVLIIALYLGLNTKKISFKYLQISSIISVILFLYLGNVFGIIMTKIFSYSTTTTSFDSLKFLNVNTTVSEASHIPWFIIFDRIIGSSIGLVIAVIGYLLLLKKYKEFIIALPLWVIGFFAFIGGLRFTVYAVPIAAISGVYFFIWLNSFAKNNKFQTITIFGTIFLILPNITHILGCCEHNNNIVLNKLIKYYPIKSYPYLMETTFKKSEVEVLDKLKHKSNDKDFVITWWDYGYPIWYYADVNTLIDGGKHNEDNYIVSKILTSSNPYLVANLSKIAIDKYVKNGGVVATQIFIKNSEPINVDAYLKSISTTDFKAPKLKRDVYLMFPYRMFDIFPVVSRFSNRDLNTGKKYSNHFYYKNKFHIQSHYIVIGNFAIDMNTGFLLIGSNKVPIKHLDVVSYDKKGKLNIQKQIISNEGLNVVILKSYNTALILDDYYYNSSFVQMFVFENYDHKLFEPVILNPIMKIYKIK